MTNDPQRKLIPYQLNQCEVLNEALGDGPEETEALRTERQRILGVPFNNMLYRFVTESGPFVFRAGAYRVNGNLITFEGTRVVQKMRRTCNWYFLLQEGVTDIPCDSNRLHELSYEFSAEENLNVIEVPWDPRPGERTPKEYFDRMIRFYENMFLDRSKSLAVAKDRYHAARAIVRIMDSELACEIPVTEDQNLVVTRARSYNQAMEELGWTD